MTAPVTVAIDGPSGSGKSTVSRRLAAERGLAYLDTGAMYRAATWWCRRQGIDLEAAAEVTAAVAAMPLEMGIDPAAPTVVCDGVDITTDIRRSEISAVVSAVATNLDVRAELRDRQRAIIAAERRPGGHSDGRGIVAEGRDVTTVIAPDAEVRILLTADESARLARRARELHGSDDAAHLAATRAEVVDRDARDSTVSTFLTAADGVVTIDSSAMDLDQTLAVVRDVVDRAQEGTL